MTPDKTHPERPQVSERRLSLHQQATSEPLNAPTARVPESPAVEPATQHRRPAVVAIIAVAAVLALMEFGARAIEPNLSDVSPWGQIGIEYAVGDLEDAPNGAVLLLGSSAVRRGLDADLLAETAASTKDVHNAAFDAASPRTVALFAEEVVLPRSQASTIVIGVSTHDLNDEGLVQATTLTHYTEAPARLDAVGRLATSGRIALELGELSSLVRVRNQLRSPVAVFEAVTASSTSATGVEYQPGGPFDTFWSDQILTNYTVGGIEASSLRRAVAAMQQEANVILVDMPIMESQLAELHPKGMADIESYRAELEAIGDEFDATVLWANEIGWGREHFADPAHLNPAGSRRLTLWLAAQVDVLSGA